MLFIAITIKCIYNKYYKFINKERICFTVFLRYYYRCFNGMYFGDVTEFGDIFLILVPYAIINTGLSLQ